MNARALAVRIRLWHAPGRLRQILMVTASSDDRRSNGFGWRATHPCLSRRSTLLLVAPMPTANSAARSATRAPGVVPQVAQELELETDTYDGSTQLG